MTYDLSFWHIYAPSAGPIGDFAVKWNGAYVYGPIASTSPPSPLTWTQYSFKVVGTGSDTLSIFSRNDPSYQGLDDVSVTATVPEPATWAIMLIGIGGIGAAMRGSRRRTFSAFAAA